MKPRVVCCHFFTIIRLVPLVLVAAAQLLPYWQLAHPHFNRLAALHPSCDLQVALLAFALCDCPGFCAILNGLSVIR
jgi:hypothetical protein